MDADGDVLAPLDWSEHNLSGFETKAAEARRFAEVKKRAATGDRTSQFTLLKSWLEWNSIPLEQARKMRSELEDIPDPQKAALDKALTLLEVESVMYSLTRDTKTWVAAGKRFYTMSRDGKIPNNDRHLFSFWYLIITYAEHEKDIYAFETGLKAFKENSGTTPRTKKLIENWEKTLEELKAERSDPDS